MSPTRRSAIWLLAAVLLVAGCREEPRTLVLLVGADEPAPTVGALLVETFAEADSIRLELRVGGSESENLAALREGRADLTIATDLGILREDLRTLVSLYPGILHLLHADPSPPPDLAALLRDRRVYAGPEGGIGRHVLADLASEAGVPLERLEIIDSPWAEGIEVFLSIGGLLTRSSLRELPRDLRLYSFDERDRAPGRRIVDGLSIRFPYLAPFEIPAGLYGRVRPEAATTVALRSLLVGRPDLPRETGYAISRRILDRRASLRAHSAILHQGLTEDFDSDVLSIPLHDGARDFHQRREPAFLERYADAVGVILSLFIALASGLFTLRNWTRQRRKDRIDAYYEEVMALRDAEPQPRSAEEADHRIEQIRRVQRRAFDQLIAERLDANESFHIFVSLCRDAIGDLRAVAPPEAETREARRVS